MSAASRLVLAFAALSCLAGTSRAGDGPTPVLLDGPALVEGLRIVDIDGDGIADLLVVAGREIRAWQGAKGAGPSAKPTWVFRVPEEATFVGAGPTPKEGEPRVPSLVALAGTKVLRLTPGAAPTVVEGISLDLPWSDPKKAVLADFVHGRTMVLPTAQGFRWIPEATSAPGTGHDLPAPPTRRVAPPGPFVEDTATLSTTWPAVTLLAPPARKGAGPGAAVVVDEESYAYFTVEEGQVVAHRISTSALPKDGDHRLLLVDFDHDGVPDVVHEQTANESGVYTFLAARLGTPGPAGTPPSFDRKAGGVVKLTGFQLPADYVDLDGDGFPDLVVTTIDIDGTNVVRAVMQHRVVAKTRAFLNRKGADPAGPCFHGSPDAEVESEVGIRILFSFSGSIDVRRSFTILATPDLDGDGRKDLVLRTVGGALAVRRGVAKGVWETDARKVEIPAVGASPDVEGYVGDLSGDGKDDLVLLYRAPPGGADRTVVLVSP